MDQSIKYVGKIGPIHLGAMYEFGSYSGSTNTGYQIQLGAEFAGFSVDGYYFKKYDAISVSSLSAAQVADITNACNADVASITTPPPPPATPPSTAHCYSISNSVAGTISDNKTYMVTALWNMDPIPLKLYAGYEHIAFDNPTDPLDPGTVILGGYVMATTKNTAFDKEKTLQIGWAGLKWALSPQLELTGAWYGYKQNSFATGAHAGCSDTSNSACSGTLNAISGLIDYKFTKRFDMYFGSFWSGVRDGLANGYYAKDNVATTLGARFKF